MLANLLSTAVLASAVLIPVTLKFGGSTIALLFDAPSSRAMRCLYVFVIVLQGVAAVAWLTMKLSFYGQPAVLWAILLFLGYLWIRVFQLINGCKTS